MTRRSSSSRHQVDIVTTEHNLKFIFAAATLDMKSGRIRQTDPDLFFGHAYCCTSTNQLFPPIATFSCARCTGATLERRPKTLRWRCRPYGDLTIQDRLLFSLSRSRSLSLFLCVRIWFVCSSPVFDACEKDSTEETM